MKKIAHINRKTNLDFIHISKLSKIFDEKKWKKEEFGQMRFDSFCCLFENLDDTQKELMYELTNNFLYFSDNNTYIEYYFKSLKKINSNLINKCEKIYVVPLLNEDDIKKNKSPKTLLYLTKGHIFKGNKEFAAKPFIVKEDAKLLPSNMLQENYLLLLIDDFIGSGETAEKAIDYLRTFINIENVQTKIISLVSMEEGVNKINDMGFEVCSEIILKKGISDYNKTPIKEKKIEIMLSIEKLLKNLNGFYSLGYLKSEGLVSLIRTPDNTFPVYWMEFETDKEIFQAPFQREEIR
jgi:uracil phosphoribosyltransferase